MTWLSDRTFDLEILPANYIIYRNDRGSRGGGILIAVNELIASTLLPSPPNLKVISIEIKFRSLLCLCTVYISPNSDDDYCTSLLDYLKTLVSSFDHVVIVGDFNLPDIDWPTLTGISSFFQVIL